VFRSARETGPVLLIPLAWTFVAATHLGAVRVRTLFIAHIVMSVLLAAFAVTAWADMREGVLRVWWNVIAVGFVAAALGAIGFRLETGAAVLHAIALFGWMLLPAVGLLYTGQWVTEAKIVYYGGGTLCVVGALVYPAGIVAPIAEQPATVAALAVVGLGQTAGVLDAAVRY
jgi:hypothetical protein